MTRFAVLSPVVAALLAVAITAGAGGDGVAPPAMGTPAASPAVCPTLGAATPAASPTAPPPAAMTAGSVTIEITDLGFDPSGFQSAVGQDVRITLHNRGSRPHSFRIDRLHVDVLVPPGQTRTVTIPSPPLGDYRFVSDAPCDDASSMTGMMIIFI